MTIFADNEVSRPIKVDDIGTTPQEYPLSTTPDERTAVARRLDLRTLDKLDGEIVVRMAMGRQILVEGTIRAEIVQTCVVTGDAVPSSLTFALRRVYEEGADPFGGLAEKEDDVITELDDDEPDAPVDGYIDIGEAVVEELALQIPAYPRAEGVNFDGIDTMIDEDAHPENPFAVLSDLKNHLKTKQ